MTTTEITEDERRQAGFAAQVRNERSALLGKGEYFVQIGTAIIGKVVKTEASRTNYWQAYGALGNPVGPSFETYRGGTRADAVRELGRSDAGVQAWRVLQRARNEVADGAAEEEVIAERAAVNQLAGQGWVVHQLLDHVHTTELRPGDEITGLYTVSVRRPEPIDPPLVVAEGAHHIFGDGQGPLGVRLRGSRYYVSYLYVDQFPTASIRRPVR